MTAPSNSSWTDPPDASPTAIVLSGDPTRSPCTMTLPPVTSSCPPTVMPPPTIEFASEREEPASTAIPAVTASVTPEAERSTTPWPPPTVREAMETLRSTLMAVFASGATTTVSDGPGRAPPQFAGSDHMGLPTNCHSMTPPSLTITSIEELASSAVTRICVAPAARAISLPAWLTETTNESALSQLNVRSSRVSPWALRETAAIDVVSCTARVSDCGES